MEFRIPGAGQRAFPPGFVFILFWALYFFWTVPSAAQSGTRFHEPVPVTTNPGEDFAPTVSPDGTRLVYVSDRSGNLDLWLKHLGSGIQPPDERLTTHPAEDNSPAFAPDGNRIIFVSHRSDAKGDLYLLDLTQPRGEEEASRLVRLTEGTLPESDPAWSPDQKFVYFTSVHPETRQQTLYKLDLESKTKSILATGDGGLDPAVSPDGRYLAYVVGGDLPAVWVLDLQTGKKVPVTLGEAMDVSPRWTRDGEKIVFARYRDDTNFDGKLTIDDNPNLWSVEFGSMKAGTRRQLTDSSTYDLLPFPAPGDQLFYTSDRGKSIDVWSLPLEGLIPAASGYGSSLQVAEDLCSEEAAWTYRCLAAYGNVIRLFPAEPTLARLRYKVARGSLELGHLKRARLLFAEVIEKHPDRPEYRGLAEIDLFLLDLEKTREEGQTVYQKNLEEGVQKLDQMIKAYRGQPHVEARAYLEKGYLLLKLDNPTDALKAFKVVVGQYPRQRALSAEAAFAQSKIYTLVGDQGSLIQTFVQVVRDYYDVEAWREKAIQEILDLHEQAPTLEKKVSSLHKLTVQFQDLPRLAAAVQNRIGEIYRQAHENLLAKEAYRKSIEKFSEARGQTLKARLALADIYAEEENFEKSLEIYREIADPSAGLEAGLQAARQGLIRKTLEKGNWELRVGEVKLAFKTFLKLIDFAPETVDAHRGYLQAAAALRKIEPALEFYRQRLKAQPDSAVDLYALGLAYTYLTPPDLDQAEEFIGQALGVNSQQVFFHQTLGWVFEQMERQKPKQDYLERALHEYEIALALNDETRDPDNEANLLLNLGNGHYLLNNPFAAYHYYKQRKRAEMAFVDPNREAVYHRRFGESAFKAGVHEEALRQYQAALALFSEKKDLERMAELNDRIALVYQDLGDHGKAVEYFSNTLDLHQQTGNRVSLSRTLRNIANNLFELNREAERRDPQALNRALSHYFQAIENLERYGVVTRKKKEKRGLIDIELQAGLGKDVSAAATGFDKIGEQKLIFHYIGKIYGDFGEYDKAIDYFQKKLALIPDNLDPQKNIPVLLEKALLLNQIGNYYFRSGDYAGARPYFQDSYALSQTLDNRHGMLVNAANIGRVVFIQCQSQPLASLRQDLLDTVALLRAAVEAAGPVKEVAQPEYLVLLQNYRGIFYYYLGFHLSPPGQEKPSPALSPARLKAALGTLRANFDWVRKSIGAFEKGLELLKQAEVSDPALEQSLRQNLDFMVRLVGPAGKKAPAAEPQPSFATEWQYRYLDAVMADPDQHLPLLLEAERLLTRLPYGMAPRDASSLALQEDLYRAITRTLFDQERFLDALYYSEKGKQQLLVSLNPRLRFAGESRAGLFEELLRYRERMQAALAGKGEDHASVEEILTEYEEFRAFLEEEDPDLASLVLPAIPFIEEIQALLRPGQVLLKYQPSSDGIYVWVVTPESVRGGHLEESRALALRIRQIAREKSPAEAADVALLSQALVEPVRETLEQSTSLLLIADGALEFLPWPALRLNEKPLVEQAAVTFLSSVLQLRLADSKKNLYNSRLLAVESSNVEEWGKPFVSTVTLTGDQATRDRFFSRWRFYGVVHLDSPARVNRLDPALSYLDVTRRTNHFQRIRLDELLTRPFEANFIALSQLSWEFHPELRLSPTAPLIQGLTFKGYPGILMHPGVPDPDLHADLLRLFYSRYRGGHPAEALRQAQAELAGQSPDSLAWARYRYYGFPGMTEEEKTAFAQTHFQATAQAGARAFLEKEWLKAIDHFEKSLVLLDFLPEGDRFAEKIYKTLAQAAYNLQDYRKGIHYQKALLRRVEKKESPEELAEAYYFLGILESRAEDYSVAVDHLKKALAIYEEHELLDRLAESYSTLGIIEENALDYDQALEAFTASLKIHEEIGEDLHRGRELRRIGRIYYLRLNQYAQARQFFQEANRLFTELGHDEQRVETLLELGLVAEKEGDFPEALQFYKKAQSLAAQKNLQEGLSKALLYQANSHWYQGNYQKAFRFQKESLEIAQAIEDKRQQTFIYNTLGLIYWTLNDSPRALTHLHRSLDLAKEIQSPLDIASAYNNIGLVHRKDGDYEKSIEFFKKALAKDIELKSKWGQGYTHRNLGMSYLRLDRLEEAGTHIDQAITLSREIGNRTNLVKSMLEKGHLALERNQCDQAVPVFQETSELADRLNIREVQWRALRGEGLCLARGGQKSEAIEIYKQAVDIVDQMRAAIKVEEFQNGFLTDKQDVYKELVLLFLDQGRIEESFNYAERAKSRSFIDLLGNQKVSLKDDVDQELYDALTEQKLKIQTTEEALGVARAKGEDPTVQRLSQQLIAERNRYQDLLIQAKQESPEISSFVTVETITVEEVAELIDESVALLEYLVTPEELVTWVITRGEIRVARTPLVENELNALVKDYRRRMQQLAPLEEQSRQLHGWLIEPVQAWIAEKRVLGIVPHGHLHYVSFASLFDGESYLVERHPLFYSPSASVLKFTFQRKYEKSPDVKVLALGNPDLGDFNYELPLAELEAQSIKWDFPKIDILTGDRATESWLHRHIGDYQIIHIASHGEFDPINPLFSSLKLAKDQNQDGNFEVNEVFSLKVNADLVTLSACQTGLGQITGGDELVGLNRAFIYAGTHSILSSLWRVSDVSTAILIKHFYRNYVDRNKSESLRQAQLQVKTLYPHPSYWAGFNLTGDYR